MLRQGGQSLARRLTGACINARAAQEGSLTQVRLGALVCMFRCRAF